MKRLLMATLLLAAPAGAYELPDVVKKMEGAEASFKSIGFSFSQEVRFTEMEGKNTVNGTALFAQPNLMRIEKLTPERQLTVSNGKTMWVHNPAFKQVWQGSWKNWVDSSAVPQGLVPISGYMADLKKRFDLAVLPTRDGSVRLQAKPKEASVGYELEFTVSTETWIPSRTVYRSESAVVVTDLTDVVFNPAAGADKFTFKAPAGTDVIPLN